MKFQSKLKIFITVVIIALVIGLYIWTIDSPPPIEPQSSAQLQSGLFGYSNLVADYNITDGSGTYHFSFGLEYNQTITEGARTRFAVYCGLTGEEISSPFTKGMALSLKSGSISIDGQADTNATISSEREPSLQIYYFELSSIVSSAGNHSMQVRLVFATIDLNYIGNSVGTYQIVEFNGTILLVH